MSEFQAPDCDLTDPASLETWYSGYGASFFEHYRKIVLASCKEIIRASSSLQGTKLSESRIEDLSRLHPNYLGFLATHLDGRRVREASIRQPMGL